MNFIQALREDQTVTSIVLNGDLMDLPPYPAANPNQPVILEIDGRKTSTVKGKPPGFLQPEYEPVLECLGSLSSKDRMVTYITGNHDIGVTGLRFARPDLAALWAQVAWNPSVLTKINDELRVYIEHGHYHDPFLWLYMRYELFDLLRGNDIRRLRAGGVGGQRAGNVGQRWETGYGVGTCTDISTRAVVEKRGFLDNLVVYRFRHAARKAFKALNQVYGESVCVLIFGHTHLPDRYEFPGGRIYCNSGDWAGNSPDQTYIVIEPDGRVYGPVQWAGQSRL